MQTKLGSFVEASANIAVGYTIAFISNLTILPLFGFTSLTIEKNFLIGAIYTGISYLRSYIIRRWFNGLKFGNVNETSSS